MNNRDIIILKKIIQYSNEIQSTMDRYSVDVTVLESDFVIKNAISMCILQIGELVGKLTDEFKAQNNQMPWRDIKAMRNIAAHNYGEIDIDILWETISSDIPALKEYCEKFV